MGGAYQVRRNSIAVRVNRGHRAAGASSSRPSPAAATRVEPAWAKAPSRSFGVRRPRRPAAPLRRARNREDHDLSATGNAMGIAV
jgi:hypothetical protein